MCPLHVNARDKVKSVFVSMFIKAQEKEPLTYSSSKYRKKEPIKKAHNNKIANVANVTIISMKMIFISDYGKETNSTIKVTTTQDKCLFLLLIFENIYTNFTLPYPTKF